MAATDNDAMAASTPSKPHSLCWGALDSKPGKSSSVMVMETLAIGLDLRCMMELTLGAHPPSMAAFHALDFCGVYSDGQDPTAMTWVAPGDVYFGFGAPASEHLQGGLMLSAPELLAPKSTHLSCADAASCPSAYLTGCNGLGVLSTGISIASTSTVLVHNAANPVGQAACVALAHGNHNVIGTAGSHTKRWQLRFLAQKRHQAGVSAALSSSDRFLTACGLSNTDGRGGLYALVKPLMGRLGHTSHPQTLLLSGGTGGLGLLVGAWASAAQNNMPLRLLGRTGRSATQTSESAPLRLKSLVHGKIVSFGRSDVSLAEECNGTAIEARQGSGQTFPAPGVCLHASGVLADATLPNQSCGGMRQVFGPKVGGDMQLRASLFGQPVQSTVLFSSITSLLGSSGQINYTAANAVLDAHAHMQQGRGCAELSVQWGAWGGESGMAARDAKVVKRMERIGFGMLPVQKGLKALQGLVHELHLAAGTRVRNGAMAQARDNLELVVSKVVSSMLNEEVDMGEPLLSAGVDSLGASELANLLGRELGVQLPGTLVFDYPTGAAIVEYVAGSEFSQGSSRMATSADVKATPSAQEQVPQHGRRTAPDQQALSTTITHIVNSMVEKEVALDEPLMSAGIDSLSATELSNQIGQAVGLMVPSTLLFDYPTAGAIASYISEELSTAGLDCTIEAEADFSASGTELELLSVGEAQPPPIVVVACAGTAGSYDTVFTSPITWTDALGVVPIARWDVDASGVEFVPEGDVRFGAFMSDVEHFDGELYHMKGAEAVQVDPQQRRLLQHTTEMLHSAARPDSLASEADVGVYVGITWMEYAKLATKVDANPTAYSATGGALSVASGRISYHFGLKGPAVSIDTACSSSLVATCMALGGMHAEECGLASVAGVNLMLTSETTRMFQCSGMLASDGRCKTLDAAADGYIRSEACVTMLLAPDAEEDPVEHPMLMMYGGAVNQDGRASSLTAPNGPSQQAVLLQASQTAEASHALDLLQLHGTGTGLGDPIEISAACAALRGKSMDPKDPKQSLSLSASKSFVGHTEPAAGMIGLAHSMQEVCHRVGSGVLHFTALNPHISTLAKTTECGAMLQVLKQPTGLAFSAGIADESSEEFYVGVSSFAFQGTNAHVIIGDVVGGSRMAPLHDNQLHGRGVLSFANLIEMTCAASDIVIDANSTGYNAGGTIICDLAIPRMVVLPPVVQSARHCVNLSLVTHLQSGLSQLQTASGGNGSAACAVWRNERCTTVVANMATCCVRRTYAVEDVNLSKWAAILDWAMAVRHHQGERDGCSLDRGVIMGQICTGPREGHGMRGFRASPSIIESGLQVGMNSLCGGRAGSRCAALLVSSVDAVLSHGCLRVPHNCAVACSLPFPQRALHTSPSVYIASGCSTAGACVLRSLCFKPVTAQDVDAAGESTMYEDHVAMHHNVGYSGSHADGSGEDHQQAAERGRTGALHALVLSTARSLIGDEALEEDDLLLAAGLDSLSAIDLRNALSRATGLQLPTALIMDGGSVNSIAQSLLQAMPENSMVTETMKQPSVAQVTCGGVIEASGAYDGRRIPLSHAQTLFWAHYLMDPASSCYNMGYVLNIKPSTEVQPAVLESCVASAIRYRSALRVAFAPDGSYQLVIPAVETQIRVQHCSYAEVLDVLDIPFDLVNERPPLRVFLVKADDTDQFVQFLVVAHHITADAKSLAHFTQDVWRSYDALIRSGQSSINSLEGAETGFFRHVEAQAESVAVTARQGQLERWRDLLMDDSTGGSFTPLKLVKDFPEPVQHRLRTQRSGHIGLEISPATATALQALAGDLRTTNFSVLLAAFALVLHSHSEGQQQDVTFGVAVDLRATEAAASFQGSAGSFATVLPVRCNLVATPTLQELVGSVQSRVMAALDNPLVPFMDLVRLCNAPRHVGSGNPLFTANISFISFRDAADYSAEAVSATMLPFPEAAFEVWMTLVEEPDGGIRGHLIYDASKFGRQSMEVMAACMVGTVTSMAHHASSLPQELTVREVIAARSIPDPDLCRHFFGGATRRLFEAETQAGADLPPEAILPTHASEFLFGMVDAYGPDLAVVDDEFTTTYAELGARIAKAASLMSKVGVHAQDCVGVLLANSHAVIELHFAAAIRHAVVTNMNTHLVAKELTHVLTMSSAKCIFSHANFGEKLFAALQGARAHTPDASQPSVVWCGHGAADSSASEVLTGQFVQLDYEDELALLTELTDSPTESGDPAEGFMMYFTSGTTGLPKGVVLSHQVVCGHALGAVVEHRISRHDVWLHVAPMFHLVDAFAIYSLTWTGGRHVVQAQFDAATTLSAIQRERVSITNMASTMITVICSNPMAQYTDCSSLRLISCGGSPLAPAVVRQAVALFGSEFFVSYGMTECCGKISMSFLQSEGITPNTPLRSRLAQVSTSGRPFMLMSVQLLDAESGLVITEPGNPGEVWIKGPSVFAGYEGAPEDTQDSFQNGWFKTGDVATWDTLGYLTVMDRSKDMILVGGENVYSVEVENALYMHPAVREAAVFGVPNQVLGEMVMAAVTLRPGQAASSSNILEFCREQLSGYKVPYRVAFVTAMPRSGAGKILKRELKDAYIASSAGVGMNQSAPNSVPLYERTWCPVTPSELAEATLSETDDGHRRWLVLHDDSALGMKVVQAVCKVSESAPGCGESIFWSTTERPLDVSSAIAQISEIPFHKVTGVIFAVSPGSSATHTASPQENTTSSVIHQTQQLVEAALFAAQLAQHCAHASLVTSTLTSTPFSLVFVTHGAASTTVAERVMQGLAAAPLGGLAEGLSTVFGPAIGCHSVDLHPGDLSDVEHNLLWSVLAQGRSYATGGTSELALRRGCMMLPRLATRHSTPRPPTANLEYFAPKGAERTYVVAGPHISSLSGLVAQWLAREAGCKHLALLGRFADRHEVHPLVDKVSELPGVRVVVHNVDVYDEESLGRSLEHVSVNMPPCHTVFYMDHTTDAHKADEPFLHASTIVGSARSAALRGPTAVLNLHGCIQQLRIGCDSLVICKGALMPCTAALMDVHEGVMGTFMESYCASQLVQQSDFTVSCLALGTWAVAAVPGVEGGDLNLEDAIRVGEFPVASALIGLDYLLVHGTASPLSRACTYLLRDEAMQVHTENARVGMDSMAEGRRHQNHQRPSSTSQLPARPSVAQQKTQQEVERQQLQLVVADAVQQALATAVIDSQAPLWDLGLTSLTAVTVSAAIEESLGQGMPATLLFDYPTIDAISHFLCARSVPRDTQPQTIENVIDEPPREVAVAMQLELAVRAAAEQALNAAEVPLEQSLWEMGMTSVAAVSFSSAVEGALGLSMPATLVFDYPTLESIVRFISQQHGDPTPANQAQISIPRMQPQALGSRGTLPSRQPQPSSSNRRGGILREVAAVLSDVLSKDDLGVDDPLWEAGMTSIRAVELSTSLQNSLGCDVPATLAFDYPSLRTIADYIGRQMPELDDPGNDYSISAAAADAVAELASPFVTSFGLHTPQEPRRERILPSVTAVEVRLPGEMPPGEMPRTLQLQDGILPVPGARWDSDALLRSADVQVCNNFGGFMLDVDMFDGEAFGLPPRQCSSMDPQHRILLQEAYHVLSGVQANALHSEMGGDAVGVFVGIAQMDYSFLTVSCHLPVDAGFAIGAAHSVAAGRLSFVFGCRGPCLSIDTACSSSLVAAHLTATHLNTGETSRGVACGINVALLPMTTSMFTAAGMLSESSRCKTLDAAADGYGRGEACVVIGMASPTTTATASSSGCISLSRAALVQYEGGAVNQDGRSSSLTAPNGPSQQDVIRTALATGGTQQGAVAGLELHGTGTPLGDPIEISAAYAVFLGEAGDSRDTPLLISAAKSACGHAEPAAGALGVAHATMCLAHCRAAPILHLRRTNPYVVSGICADEHSGTPQRLEIGLPRTLGMDASLGCRRIKGISSFAFQGTNAHVLLVAAPPAAAARSAVHAASSRLLYVSKHWSHAVGSPLTSAALLGGTGGALVGFEALLEHPPLAHIWDHVVLSRSLFPAAGFFEMGVATARTLGPVDAPEFVGSACVDVAVTTPMVLYSPPAAVAGISCFIWVTSAGTFTIHSPSPNNTSASNFRKGPVHVRGSISKQHAGWSSPEIVLKRHANHTTLSSEKAGGFFSYPAAVDNSMQIAAGVHCKIG
eukprot:gene816-1294_t